MNRGTKGIVIFAVAYFILFVGLEWYISSTFSSGGAFYASPQFVMAIIVYVAIVAVVLLKYRHGSINKK